MRWIALTLALAFAIPAQAQDALQSRLTVTGTGTVSRAPDMAVISLGAAARAESAAAAMDETSAATAAILAQLQQAGVAPRDIQTSTLSLRPLYDTPSSKGGSDPRITGYDASNTVTIRIRALDDLGGILDAALNSGANTFHGLRFALQDPAPALDEARRRAVAEAMRKAALYADAAGVALGPLRDLSESGGGNAPMMMRAEMAESVPVAAGELEVEARVTMVFSIETP